MGERKYFSSEVLSDDSKLYLTCDGQCGKAFGKLERPSSPNSLDENDFEWLADEEVGEAPSASKFTVNGENKPQSIPELHNAWCIGLCERAILMRLGQRATLPNFNKRVPGTQQNQDNH